jgi:hypothetical protein
MASSCGTSGRLQSRPVDHHRPTFGNPPPLKACRFDFDPGTNSISLQDFGKPGNYIARQIERWSRQYRAAETQTNTDMDHLIDWLPTAVPGNTDRRLIHGDFAFHNVFFASDTPHVVAVVDWELSTLGDPIVDITYQAMDWYRPASPQRATLTDMNDSELTAAGIPTLASYLRTYCDRVGRPGIDNLAFYQAYNLFRTAAITPGVPGNWRDVPAPCETETRSRAHFSSKAGAWHPRLMLFQQSGLRSRIQHGVEQQFVSHLTQPSIGRNKAE